MKQISIPVETLLNLAALEGHPLALDASPEMLCADTGARYDFLHQPVEVRLEDSMVLIRSTEEPEEEQAEAARLFARARRRARDGEYERVAALCRRALSLWPALHEARRELVRAYLETDDRANAQAALWQAPRLNPRDTWSLVTLADLLVESGEADKAERLPRMALQLEPANTDALDALGRAQLQAGHEREALGAFGRALSLKPQLAAARLGSARALLRQNKPEEALAFLQQVFTEAGAGPAGAQPAHRRRPDRLGSTLPVADPAPGAPGRHVQPPGPIRESARSPARPDRPNPLRPLRVAPRRNLAAR